MLLYSSSHGGDHSGTACPLALASVATAVTWATLSSKAVEITGRPKTAWLRTTHGASSTPAVPSVMAAACHRGRTTQAAAPAQSSGSGTTLGLHRTDRAPS